MILGSVPPYRTSATQQTSAAWQAPHFVPACDSFRSAPLSRGERAERNESQRARLNLASGVKTLSQHLVGQLSQQAVLRTGFRQSTQSPFDSKELAPRIAP